MTPRWEIVAMCLHADTPLDCPEFRQQETTRRQMKAQVSNRAIWADSHYRKTGHHRFEFSDTQVFEVSVAKITDPNQLRLSDDPDNAHLDPSNWGMKT